MLRVLFTSLTLLILPLSVSAQNLQAILQTHADEVARPSRNTVGAVLNDLLDSDLPEVPVFLERWQSKELRLRLSDGLFFYSHEDDSGLALIDISSGSEVATGVAEDALKNVKPNGGVRRAIGEALIRFRLSDSDITKRQDAVDALARNLGPSQLEPLLKSLANESDPALLTRKNQLVTYLQARFGASTEIRVEAISSLSNDLSVEGRAVLNQILSTRPAIAETLPEGINIARILPPGTDEFDRDAAYASLVTAGFAQAPITAKEIRNTLEAHIDGGFSGGVPLAQFDDVANRIRAYNTLVESGDAPALVTDAGIDAALAAHVFLDVYEEVDTAVTDAAGTALNSVEIRVALSQTADLALDGISLASIYFLAAIGLAITFGVMGVINMAHGEFIMMGAYTGYLVQLVVPDYTLSLAIALPLAFAVTFGAGVAMERLVIRHLYHRPLETLLATFGISVALQQLAKNIFGTQARPLTSPGWLDGALIFNDVIQISFIRIAIFVLAVLFLGLLLFILKRTRLGLEVRAVTQNPRMAASMGINPDRINMLTFGLGSGIAGIAGVAIGLYAKVTSEMGADYIVQSFMTVVVGGVGNVWGALAGASMIGFLQKGIEWLNPSNTLAAQTYMILFIILFIQFRPRGIVALKGRAAGG